MNHTLARKDALSQCAGAPLSQYMSIRLIERRSLALNSCTSGISNWRPWSAHADSIYQYSMCRSRRTTVHPRLLVQRRTQTFAKQPSCLNCILCSLLRSSRRISESLHLRDRMAYIGAASSCRQNTWDMSFPCASKWRSCTIVFFEWRKLPSWWIQEGRERVYTAFFISFRKDRLRGSACDQAESLAPPRLTTWEGGCLKTHVPDEDTTRSPFWWHISASSSASVLSISDSDICSPPFC